MRHLPLRFLLISVLLAGSPTLLLAQTANLSGTVSDTNSAGIPGATVQVLQNGTSKASTTTGSNGTYTISNLASGTYDIQVSASGYGTALHNSVLVPANQTTTQNFTLTDGITAISGANVQVYSGSAVISSAISDSAGNYSITGLNAASYRVQTSATGYVTKSQSVSVSGGSTATANFLLHWVDNYFVDNNVFQRPAPFTLGNAPRTVGSVRSPWSFTADLSVGKQFRIREEMNFEFRVEAKNALNHPVFGTPDTNVGDDTFGTIGYTAIGPREVQLGFKFNF